jgi:prepilin signal peptidase PulO-like enzyme (type II secretory pathway)
MTGTPTVNNVPVIIYYSAVCAALIAFSLYDIRTQRVPNKALAVFAPIVLLGSFLSGTESLFSALIQSLLGAVCGFGVLLAAGLISKDGAGIGGGDIKLAGIIGFAFGPYWMMAILLLAALLAAPIGLIYMLRKKRGASLHMAFAPFMTIGSLIAAAAKLSI